MLRNATLTATLAFLAVLPFTATAGPGHGGRPRRPPPEAVAACKSRSAGDACSVTLRDRTLDGVCRAAPEGGELACMPDGPPPGPPPEAVDACASKAAGDACTVSFPDGNSVEGVCRSGPDGNGPLACAPNGPPPRRE